MQRMSRLLRIAGDYANALAGRQVYLYVWGGDSGGSGANSAIGLMSVLGTCPGSGNFTAAVPFVFVNGVSTVAAAYAMAGFATDATHVSSSGSGLEMARIAIAFDHAEGFANPATGFANTVLPARPGSIVPQRGIDTLANILSSCINSGGPGSADCAILFRGTGSGEAEPGDTANAALAIAHHPAVNVPALYGLQPSVGAPFLPDLGSAPEDFSVPFPNEERSSVAFPGP